MRRKNALYMAMLTKNAVMGSFRMIFPVLWLVITAVQRTTPMVMNPNNATAVPKRPSGQ
jgi:hypothetical protein